jgi:hypothetical protein
MKDGIILGLSGKIKSGKSTTADLIHRETKGLFEEKYFAKKLKFIAAYLTGDDIKNFETQEGKEGFLPEWGITRRKMLQILGTESLRNNFDDKVWIKSLFADYKPQPAGSYMEYSTTETGERIALGFNQILQNPNWIISDVRFDNEADAVKERNGILIRVNRPAELIYPKEWNTFMCDIGDLVIPDEKMFHTWLSYSKDENLQDLHKKLTHPSETGLDEYKAFDYVIDNVGTLEDFERKVKDVLKSLNLI